MKRKFSLLFPADIDSEYCVSDASNLDPNLLLEQGIKNLNPNEKAIRAFLRVLSTPIHSNGISTHRSEILQDFYENPALVSKLLAACKTLDCIPPQFQAERSLTRATAAFGSDARFLTAEKQIILAAATLLQVFQKLAEIRETLENFPVRSKLFLDLKTRFSRLFDAPEFQELNEVLERIITMPEDYKIDLQFSLNTLGKLCQYDVLSIEKAELQKAEQKGLFKLFKRNENGHVASEDKVYRDVEGFCISCESHTLRNQVIGGVYEKMSEIFHLMLQGLFSEFCGMSSEFHFYHVALSLLTFYEKSEIPFCFPEFSEEKTLQINNLYDFALLSERHGKETVVPNDVILTKDQHGILISGDNNCGKTVYLRALATALLFAKNGLPIPASSATISPNFNLYSLFASGEKATSIGTGAGRFEEEVSALSEIVDLLKDGDLLFLNEIFQTTAYDEGADGLYHILLHLQKRGVRWVAVSHLTKLHTLFSKKNVAFFITTSPTGETPYKLIPQ